MLAEVFARLLLTSVMTIILVVGGIALEWPFPVTLFVAFVAGIVLNAVLTYFMDPPFYD